MSRFIHTIVTIVLLFLVGLLLFKRCEEKREYQTFIDNQIGWIDSARVELVNAEKRIYQGRVTIQERNKYIETLLDTISNLRNVTSATKIIIETKYDTVEVPYKVPVFLERDNSDYLKLPSQFEKKSEWYNISGEVNKSGLQFTELSFKNDLFITTGDYDYGSKFKNFFNRNRKVINVRDNNPYSMTTNVSQIIINEPKKRFHIGPMVGYGITENGTGYFIGIGGTYSAISF